MLLIICLWLGLAPLTLTLVWFAVYRQREPQHAQGESLPPSRNERGPHVQDAHRWVQQSSADGVPYERCSRCGADRYRLVANSRRPDREMHVGTR